MDRKDLPRESLVYLVKMYETTFHSLFSITSACHSSNSPLVLRAGMEAIDAQVSKVLEAIKILDES